MLMLWLPLQGDNHNQGLLDVTVSNLGTVSYTDGKIGKSLQAGVATQTSSGLSINTNLVEELGDEYSIAVWVRTNGTHVHYNGTIISSGNWNTPNGRWAFGVSQDNSKVDVFGPNHNVWLDCTVPVGEWTHLVSTQKNGVGYLYKNGEYVGSKTLAQAKLFSDASNVCVGRETYAGGYFSFNGNICDLRIYNHCLSEREIKELAKGLVAHWKLDEGFGNPNLMPRSTTMELGAANPAIGRWRNAGSNSMDKSRPQITDSPIGTCYCFQNSGVQTYNDGSCYGIDAFPTEANTDYVISLYARTIAGTGGKAGFNIYASTYIDGSYTATEKNYRVTPLPDDGSWVRCWCHVKTNAATTRNIYIGITTGDESVTTQMCAVKLEKGSTPTSWIPYEGDEDFPLVLTGGDQIYDSSGYGHDGEAIGDCTIKADTERYLAATHIESISNKTNRYNVNVSCLKLPIEMVTPEELTIAFWGNLALGYGNAWQGVLSFSNTTWPTDYLAAAINQYDANFCFNSSDASSHVRLATATSGLSTDGWHHYALTYDGKTARAYKDGELKTSGAFSADTTLGSFTHLFMGLSVAGGVWRKNTCDYSDVRVYATALSADDVKELYTASASIDDRHNVYARELVEG